MKQVVSVILLSVASTAATLWGYNKFVKEEVYVYPNRGAGEQVKTPANYAEFNGVTGGENPVDFTQAASAAIPATVHIKTKVNRSVTNNLPRKSPFGELFPDFDMDDFFGDRARSIPQSASGSGAIISEDGYIDRKSAV